MVKGGDISPKVFSSDVGCHRVAYEDFPCDFLYGQEITVSSLSKPLNLEGVHRSVMIYIHSAIQREVQLGIKRDEPLVRYSWKMFRILITAALIALLGQLLAAPPSNGGISESDYTINEIRMVDPGRPTQIEHTFHVDWEGKAVLKVPSHRLRGWINPSGSPIQNAPDVTISPVAQRPGLWRVDIILRDVTEPGLYTGKIVLAVEGASGFLEEKSLTIRLLASFKPTISVLPARDLSLKVSNCMPVTGHCWFTHLFAPESQNNEYAVNVRNNSPAPIDISADYWPIGVVTQEPVLLFKEGTAKSEPKAALRINRVMPGDSRQIVATVPSPDKLRAAAYSGTIQISAVPTVSGATYPVLLADKSNDGSYLIKNSTITEVATSVAVRVGVFWPFLVVLMGVLAGRVAATLATQGFQAKLDFYPRFMDLQASIERLPNRFKQVLNDLLNEAWRMVLKGIDSATIEPLFANLERHYTYVRQIEDLKVTLENVTKGTVRDDALVDTENALNQLAMRNPDMKVVQDIRDSVLKALETLGTPVRAQQGLEVMGPVGLERRSQNSILVRPPAIRFAGVLNTLAGTGTQGVGLYYEWLRPAMHLIVLTMLAIQGVWQQYVVGSEAANFGSQGIGQYAILFLWGVSSEVINKTLQTISFGPKV